MTNTPKKLDLSKPVQTRDGRKVVIYCTDAPGRFPIHGRIEGGEEPIAKASGDPVSWGLDGKYYQNNLVPFPSDLVNIPEKKRGWINIYSHIEIDRVGCVYSDKATADEFHTTHRIACIEIEYTEGQGL